MEIDSPALEDRAFEMEEWLSLGLGTAGTSGTAAWSLPPGCERGACAGRAWPRCGSMGTSQVGVEPSRPVCQSLTHRSPSISMSVRHARYPTRPSHNWAACVRFLKVARCPVPVSCPWRRRPTAPSSPLAPLRARPRALVQHKWLACYMILKSPILPVTSSHHVQTPALRALHLTECGLCPVP